MTYAGMARWLRGRLWMVWPVGIVTWLAWFGSIAYGVASTGRMVDGEGTPIGTDHLAFYSAARLIREGQPERIYDYASLGEYQGRILGWDWQRVVGFRNPPFYAVLYLPTAGLPFFLSWAIWTLIGLGFLVAAIGWLRPEYPGQVLLLALAFYPVFCTVSFGQNSFLSLAIFAATYRLLAVGRPFAAGATAGLLWFKPQLLIGLFVWWAFAPRRYARCWAGVAATGFVLAAVSWLMLPEASGAFVESLRANIGYGGENGWNKISPRAFWSLLLPDANSTVIGCLTIACMLAGIAAAVEVARRTDASVAAMFPVAVFLSLWVSPHTLIYEWMLILAAAVVLWEQFPDRRDAWVCLFALGGVALTVSTAVAKLEIEHLRLSVVVQLAVPILAGVGGLACRELVAARNIGESRVPNVTGNSPLDMP